MNSKKSEKLFQGITHIDEEIVEGAENARPRADTAARPRRKPSPWKIGGLAAACLCLFAAGAALLPRVSGDRGSGDPKEPAGLLVQSTAPPEDGRGGSNGARPTETPTADPTTVPEGAPAVSLATISGRPSLLLNTPEELEVNLNPSVEPYTVEPDLITDNPNLYLDDEEKAVLAQNGFFVKSWGGSEFFNVYEENRYAQIPSFVTVDSLMHTYHLYFSYLLRNVERNYLSDTLARLSRGMLNASIAQYEELKGSEWEEAASRNVAFFTVGASLLGDAAAAEDYAADSVRYELDCISRADGVYLSSITGDYEDYTQYIPRGYYQGDEHLERYFRAMMWYGRMHFTQENESLDRSALLMTMALASDPEAYQAWEAVYAVTSFFAGASDDFGAGEYAPVISGAYGDDATVADLPGNTEAFDTFHAMTAQLPPPAINSIPIEDGESNVIPGFRFMGQRFTIDAAIMQKLVYSSVKENSDGDRRMFPDVLDVASALGSDLALDILTENGAAGYEGYSENMQQLRAGLAQENEALWSASLYAGWLNTLRPLLEEKGEGYPVFMQSEEWSKKNLECFAGSFVELKHDTVLYTKQCLAEAGGWIEDGIDDRGYVEPEPLVYARFVRLADLTAQGLKRYGVLGAEEEEDLARLSQMARQLLTISNKELRDETLTEEEYEFIRSYGGSIEHFWYEASKEGNDSEWLDSRECPAPVVTDIATAGEQVLEIATDGPGMIYVVVKVDGKLKVAKGSVYSFYQFSWPAEDRLTDEKWRQMTGYLQDENGMYSETVFFDKPEWTASYWYE